MQTHSAREASRRRRRIDLFPFGQIEYEPGANYVSGTFEFAAPSAAGERREGVERHGSRVRHSHEDHEDRGHD